MIIKMNMKVELTFSANKSRNLHNNEKWIKNNVIMRVELTFSANKSRNDLW